MNDTIPSYKIDYLKERYNESLLKKTELTLKENKDVCYEKIKFKLDQTFFVHHWLCLLIYLSKLKHTHISQH